MYSVTVEFGTHDIYRVLMALVADNWLYLRGDPLGQEGAAIRAETREAFYPDSDAWRRGVAEGSRRVLDQAVSGIGSL